MGRITWRTTVGGEEFEGEGDEGCGLLLSWGGRSCSPRRPILVRKRAEKRLGQVNHLRTKLTGRMKVAEPVLKLSVPRGPGDRAANSRTGSN